MANSYTLSDKEQTLLKGAVERINQIAEAARNQIEKVQIGVNGVIETLKVQNDLDEGDYLLSEDFSTLYLKPVEKPEESKEEKKEQ